MKHFHRTGIVFLIIPLFLICACGKSGGGYYAAGADSGYAGRYESEMAEMPAMARSGSMNIAAQNTAPGGSGSSASSSNNTTAPDLLMEEKPAQTRKLVKRAEVRIRVEDLTAVDKPFEDLMTKYGAWTASAGIYENSRNYSIRVPSASYDDMLAGLTALGKIIHHSETAEDVTLRYYDLESRLEVKKELLETYKGYLAKARNIDEIMTVESHIADLQLEIDQTGTQFRNLANLVDYSTINFNIQGPAASSAYSEPDLKDKLAELFGSFGDVLSSGLVLLIGIIIYGVPAALIVVMLFWLLFGRIGLLKKLWRIASGKKK